MNPCSGSPAEKFALAYVEGMLTESEAEDFEEHFFECTVCLKSLQALQEVGSQLGKHPLAIEPHPRKKIFAWPRLGWALRPWAYLRSSFFRIRRRTS